MITSFKDFLLEKRVGKNERIDIFRNYKYILVAPLTEKAAMKYGAYTNWCTSVSNSDEWSGNICHNSELSDSILIYLIRLYEYYENEKIIDECEDSNMEYKATHPMSTNLSKLAIVANKKLNSISVWSADNYPILDINHINDLYKLEKYDVEKYLINEIINYIKNNSKMKK